MYTYDKQRKITSSRRKIIGAYIWISIFAVAFLVLNVWICFDLSRRHIDLLQHVSHLLVEGEFIVFWTFTIVLLVWLLLGGGLKLFKFSAVYPIIGVCAINATFLLSINDGDYLQCENMLKPLWMWFNNTLTGSVLFWILFSVAAIVIILMNFSKVLESILDCVLAITDFFSLEGIVKIIAFFACSILYQFSFSRLLLSNSVWVWGIGLTILTFAICLSWNLYAAKKTVVMEDMISSRKKSGNVLLRIIKDIVMGIAVSLLIYFGVSILCENVMGKWNFFSDIGIVDFDAQEVFFTELSLAFLVISFVPLLSNKTDSVYWVDIIQYRLVKPNHTSIVDISAYIFANLLLSLIAFVFVEMSDLLLISFVITIFLLGFLSIKLLISFFGVEHLKDELKEEYRMALEYRKLICELHYETERPFASYLSANPYTQKPVGEFGSRLDIQTEELQNIHDSLLWGEHGKKRPYLRKKSYRRLAYYARKFDNKVDKYEYMRDGLYSNTIKCIDEHKVNEICEQILLLMEYEEYDYAIDCIEKVFEQYPMVFLDLFDESFQNVARDKELMGCLNEKLIDLFSREKKLGETKYKMAINSMAKWAAGYLNKEALEAQLEKAIAQNNATWVVAVYKTGFLQPVRKMILDERQKTHLNDEVQAWEGELPCAFSREFGSTLIVGFLKHEKIDFAYEMLKEYKLFLEEIRSELSMGWYGPCPYVSKGAAPQAEICDLSDVFNAAKALYACKVISKEKFISFIKLLLDCYKCLKSTYTYSYARIKYPQKLEDYKHSLVASMTAYIQESDWDEKENLLKYF